MKSETCHNLTQVILLRRDPLWNEVEQCPYLVVKKMQITQGVTVGLAALRRNKLRSVLTTLGIIIGIAAVVAVVSVGGGAEHLMLAELERIGGAGLIVCFRKGSFVERTVRTLRINIRNILSMKTSVSSLKTVPLLRVLRHCRSSIFQYRTSTSISLLIFGVLRRTMKRLITGTSKQAALLRRAIWNGESRFV